MKELNGAGYAHLMRSWLRKNELLDTRRTTGVITVSVPQSKLTAGMIYYEREQRGEDDDRPPVSATLAPTRRLTGEELRNTSPDEETPGVQWRVSIDAGEGNSNYPMFFDDLFTAVTYLILTYD